jgi:hypothetical protein
MNATLEYKLVEADMEAFFRHHASHAPYIVARNRRMRWIWGGLLVLLALAYYYQSLVGGSIAFLALAITFLLFYDRLNRWWYIRHNRGLNMAPDGPRLGATKLELTDGHFLFELPEGSTKLKLSAIRRIDESDSHYFIYLGPFSAVVVPKFDHQADDFINALRGALLGRLPRDALV